ncbi:MAG: iron-containing alcohol dehydrogenase [Clostridiales bacterium]|nr:iron-containing alcohol dehydrogenase [Clostridiales bacterium]
MAMTDSLEVLWCRTFQAVLKVGNYFMGYRMPTYLEGPGKIRELGAFLKEKNINDVLVVTGTGMVRRGQVQPLLDGFESAGIRYTLQAFDHPDPSSDDVELGFKTYKENGCKALVALGGGSRIDCAKGIAAKAVHPKKKVSQLQGLLKVHWPIPPFVAIPTTAGAGSETTVAAVITDSATHRKAAINDPFLIPKYAVLDPELTVGLPPYTTATTGMDALAHAVEAYTNHTYNTKLENRLAKEAVKLIHDNILIAFEDGANLEARQNMQRGAFYAGRAFTRGCVGYVHAVGHTLGGLYGVAHGLAMAVLLPHVMREFGASAHKRLAELADVCGIGGENEAEKANAFIRWIEETNKKMGLPDSFDVIREEDIDQMIAWASKEANPLYPVPVVWSKKDFRRFIQSIRR